MSPLRPRMDARALGALWLLAASLASAAPAPVTREGADQLAATHAGPARDAALAAWAKRASLDDLLWVLRRDPADLGGAERALVDAALERTPAARSGLRRPLELRRLLLDPKAARKLGRENAELEALRPRVSVFRIAALLPDRGDYADYAWSVRRALAAGLRADRIAGALPLSLEVHGTGDGEPALAAAALDSVSHTCGVIVGELLSEPTFALAAGTRFLGIPLVSPTATDEAIGRVGPAVFQVGPASSARAAALARAALAAGGHRVVILTASESAHTAFVQAFAAAAESLGAAIVRHDSYPSGTANFALLSRMLKTTAPDVLFWDGEPREAEALVRQLATDGVSVRLCGGAALAPEQYHAGTRALFNGAMFVGDDWRLDPLHTALLDSLAHASGDHAGPLWIRGFLAGRRIAAAIDAGARTPDELAARLRARAPALRAAGFLDCALDGATIPVFTIARGKATLLAAFPGPHEH